MASSKRPARAGWQRTLRRLGNGAQNALEVMRIGRLGAPYAASYEVVREEPVYKLRHYARPEPVPEKSDGLCPLLLVPPLMVTSEVYDISPELSAVGMLSRAGIDTWIVDFGAPETAPGGMSRTLDDHVRAVSEAIDEVHARTGKDVHIAGYSQGGMFAYQVAAYRRSANVRSLITFGSPVDIRRNLPLPLPTRAAKRVIDAARVALEKPLEAAEGLPGFLTSTGFKLLSVRKEVQQAVEFVQNLHDRQALERRESRRRFLAGEGFVAWPGPALRKFVDEFIVHNRMASGGFVIDGRTVTLADLTCPILYFVGTTDEIARAASVRAIRHAAPAAEQHEIAVRAGHFGLVVGSKAVGTTWPAVIDWIAWRDADGPRPAALASEPEEARRIEDVDDEELDEVPVDVELFYDVATSAVDALWSRVGDVSKEVGDLIDNLRWQVPRLSRLRKIEPDTHISMSRALAEQAAAIGDHTFFLWKGRAFTYQDADRRVDNVVRGLLHCGVTKGARVGVLMQTRPSYLSIVVALNRIGAVSVLLSPESSRITLDEAVRLAEMQFLITDPENAERARAAFGGPVLSLGGFGDQRALPEGVLDMEAIDPEAVVLPAGFEPDAGQASDLAMIIFTAGRAEAPRAARITNRRWAMSALGAAAGCMLTSDDTVFCCLPLTHAAGMLVAVGGALVGGSRLALATRFDAETFWPDVRRYGATVVFYAGDMLRELVEAPPSALDATVPVRLFAGSGIRTDVWQRVVERFGRASVLEFYASTEGNAVLANAASKKIGALGKPLPGSADMALMEWDFDAEDFARDETGRLMVSGVDKPGVLIARIDPQHPMASFDGYDGESESAAKVLRGVFDPGDAWFITGDLLRRDADGDYFFVDRLTDVVRTAHGAVPTLPVEDALARCRSIRHAVAYGVRFSGGEADALVAAIVPRGALDPAALSREIREVLPAARRPRFVRLVESIPRTDGFRPRKSELRDKGIAPEDGVRTLVYDVASESYAEMDAAALEKARSQLGVRAAKRPSARAPRRV